MNRNDFKISEEYLSGQPMVFARRVGAYGSENSILMERFKEWVCRNGYMNEETIILGIARDPVQSTPPDQCRYDVCLMGNYDVNEEWILSGSLDGGRYIVIEFPHTAEMVGLFWQEAFVIVEKRGYLQDYNRPVIERYKKSLVDRHLCEMMIPVR